MSGSNKIITIDWRESNIPTSRIDYLFLSIEISANKLTKNIK